MATAIGIVVLLVITLHPRPAGEAGCGRAGPAPSDDADQFATTATHAQAPQLPDSVARAYQFLNQMMDLQTTGPAPRLVQSYTGGLLGQQGDTSASTYDNALVIDAYLAEGTAGGMARAKTIGDALVYLQAHDRAHGGRLRNGTSRPPWRTRMTSPSPTPASNTGDTGLDRAGPRPAVLGHPDQVLPGWRVALGDWIHSYCRDGPGPGGFPAATCGRERHRVEVDRAQHRRVRTFPAARPGNREPCLVV